MNFLAHSYLSPKSEYIMMGNLCGDFIKGSKMEGIHPEIAKGARIHRSIDVYTDTHPLVHQSKRIVSEKFGHYSGIIIDMFFDYFLAKNWKQQQPLSFKQHVDAIYNLNKDVEAALPAGFKIAFDYMKKGDWLSAYASQQGMEKILRQMTRRIQSKSPLFESIEILKTNEERLEDLFKEFWIGAEKEFYIYPQRGIEF